MTLGTFGGAPVDHFLAACDIHDEGLPSLGAPEALPDLTTDHQSPWPAMGFQVAGQDAVADLLAALCPVQAAMGWEPADEDPGLRRVTELVTAFPVQFILVAPAGRALQAGPDAFLAHNTAL